MDRCWTSEYRVCPPTVQTSTKNQIFQTRQTLDNAWTCKNGGQGSYFGFSNLNIVWTRFGQPLYLDKPLTESAFLVSCFKIQSTLFLLVDMDWTTNRYGQSLDKVLISDNMLQKHLPKSWHVKLHLRTSLLLNGKCQAGLDETISPGENWLRATAINKYFFKLTFAWCTDVLCPKVRYLDRKFDEFHSNFKTEEFFRQKTSKHLETARVSFKMKYPLMAVARNQISPHLISLGGLGVLR